MLGNSFGSCFRITTYGESHGAEIGVIVEGVPANFPICEEDFCFDMQRRKPGQSKFTTQRTEADSVHIQSGVFNGKTTGAPICLKILNTNAKSKDYTEVANKIRPGHADYTWRSRYKNFDYRGGGRASARETAARVAAAVIAKKYLKNKFDMEFNGFVSQIGEVIACQDNYTLPTDNAFNFIDPTKVSTLEDYIVTIRKSKDSVGALLGLNITNVPVGIGEPCFDKLDARLAAAMLSIPAAKGVEIGAGFKSAAMLGSHYLDPLSKSGFDSNNSGGVLGGLSSGEDINLNVVFKPTSSIPQDVKTVDASFDTETTIAVKGRHDPCVGIRAVPIVEAMAALTIMDLYLNTLCQPVLI